MNFFVIFLIVSVIVYCIIMISLSSLYINRRSICLDKILTPYDISGYSLRSNVIGGTKTSDLIINRSIVIGDTNTPNHSIEDCKKECDANPDCKGISYTKADQTCSPLKELGSIYSCNGNDLSQKEKDQCSLGAYLYLKNMPVSLESTNAVYSLVTDLTANIKEIVSFPFGANDINKCINECDGLNSRVLTAQPTARTIPDMGFCDGFLWSSEGYCSLMTRYKDKDKDLEPMSLANKNPNVTNYYYKINNI
jgi:hypothetical protein